MIETEQPDFKELARNSWENAFTDPREHSPQKYCYLVHAVSDAHNLMLTSERLREEGSFDHTKFIDLRAQPEKLLEKKVLSCTVVTEKYNEMFSRIAIGIESSFDNVLHMSAQDAGTEIDTTIDQEVLEVGGLMTVEQLVNDTQRGGVNEVRIKSSTGTPNEIKPTCVLYRPESGVSQEIQHEERYNAQFMAEVLNVPLIEVAPAQPKFDLNNVHIERDEQGEPVKIIVTADESTRYSFDLNKELLKVIVYEDDFRMIPVGIDIIPQLAELISRSTLSLEEQQHFVEKVTAKIVNEFLQTFKEPKISKYVGLATFTFLTRNKLYDIKISPEQKINTDTFLYDRTFLTGEITVINSDHDPDEWQSRPITKEDILSLLEEEQSLQEEDKVFLKLALKGLEIQCDPDEEVCPAYDSFFSELRTLIAA